VSTILARNPCLVGGDAVASRPLDVEPQAQNNAVVDKPGLVRAIGRWTMVALVINCIIGSGIFGLPNELAGLLGGMAPCGYLLAALGMGIIMACFAEVASRFREAGGPYLYARVAFGSFLGIQMGWLAYLVRMTSAAANANLFVIYLGEFWAPAQDWWGRAAVLSVLIGFLAVINVRGVQAGARVSNFFTIAKMVPLGVFIVLGLFAAGRIPIGGSTAGGDEWFRAMLLLVFAYGGFESALLPMGEAKNPQRDAPIALFTALGVVTTVYLLIHLVVMAMLPDPTVSNRPLAEAARVFMGNTGAMFISFGALISVYGLLSANMLNAPRLTYALAERRDFPAMFGVIHPRFRTPHISIWIYTVLTLGLALYGSFVWNAVLSAVARLFTYGLVCAALLRLRQSDPGGAAFRLPGGAVFAIIGLAFCAVLVARMGPQEFIILAVTTALALGNWLWARSRAPK